MRNTPANRDPMADLGLDLMIASLQERGIEAEWADECAYPLEVKHEPAAAGTPLIVSPRSEWGVIQTLRLLSKHGLYRHSVVVRSGTHGTRPEQGKCAPRIIIDLSSMAECVVRNGSLCLGPGCLLAHVADLLSEKGKMVPHGDRFGDSAGGHFLTAGWDHILSRRYGLGCQSVMGGRVILWDGTVIEVSEKSHRDLLHAMRGGVAAGVGVVTKIWLRLEEEAPQVAWRTVSLTERHMKDVCVAHHAFGNAVALSRDISLSLHFYFEPGAKEPSCSLDIASLLPYENTVRELRQALGKEIATLVGGSRLDWVKMSLRDARMLPASPFMASNPGMLAELTGKAVRDKPELYYGHTRSAREKAKPHSSTISYWISPSCGEMLCALYAAFQSAASHPSRGRMSALVTLGGGRTLELPCAVPLGQVMALFELQWGEPEDEAWSQGIVREIESIIRAQADPGLSQPHYGGLWPAVQIEDPSLNRTRTAYETRLRDM